MAKSKPRQVVITLPDGTLKVIRLQRPRKQPFLQRHSRFVWVNYADDTTYLEGDQLVIMPKNPAPASLILRLSKCVPCPSVTTYGA